MTEPPAADPSLEPIRDAIRKLPPFPFPVNADTMSEQFLQEVRACTTSDSLRGFVARWSPLWSINFREPGVTSPEEESLVRGTYDVDEVVNAMAYLRQEPETNEGREELERLMGESVPHKTAAHVLMPRAMVEMFMLSRYFGAPGNVAWIQAAGLVELF